MATYDVVVIGGGPGGYVAALRASALGARTAVIEKDLLGGTCLNRGCIPTKAMLHDAEAFATAAGGPAKPTPKASEALQAMYRRKDTIVARLRKGVASLLKARKVDVIEGTARLESASSIAVSQKGKKAKRISARNVILATGSRPASLPFAEADGKKVITSDEATGNVSVGKSVIVLGGGAVGIEFAFLYSMLDLDVTVVEMLPRILPQFDEEVSREIARVLKKKRVKVKAGTRITGVETGESVKVTTDKGDTIEADTMLLAAGRKPNVEDIGLEQVSIELDQGFIKIDKKCRTSVPGIYAVGDVTGGMLLAHEAVHEGLTAAAVAAGAEEKIPSSDVVPSCVYTEPEVACVGMTLAEAKENGIAAEESKFPAAALGRGAASDATTGFAKLVYETETRQLLGAHLVCSRASDIISELALAVSLEATVDDLAAFAHPHPTFGEIIGEAANAALGLPIHIM